MKAILKYEPPDHAIVLKTETQDEDDVLRRFHIRPGVIATQISHTEGFLPLLLTIRKESD